MTPPARIRFALITGATSGIGNGFAHVTCLCPGLIKSAFFGRAGMSDVRLASGNPIKLMDAETVAAIGYDALKKRKVVVVPGYRNKILAFMATVAPRAVAIRLTRWFMERI